MYALVFRVYGLGMFRVWGLGFGFRQTILRLIPATFRVSLLVSCSLSVLPSSLMPEKPY